MNPLFCADELLYSPHHCTDPRGRTPDIELTEPGYLPSLVLNKCLLSTYYMSGIVLKAKRTVVGNPLACVA